MSQVRVLNEAAIKQLLTMDETLAVIEEMYQQKVTGEAEIFPMIFHEFQAGKADMDIKSGVMKNSGIYGLKVVSWFGDNPGKQLPALFGTTLLFDSQTGQPTALLDAEYITGMRTGAAGAIGSKFLARKNSENLLLIGSGHQALFQIAAHLLAFEQIKKISVYDPLDYTSAKTFVEKLPQRLEELLLTKNLISETRYQEIVKKISISMEAVEELGTAVGQADIIVTVTPSTKPIIRKEDVSPGTHFSCVGSDISGKEEIDPQIFVNARIVVDDIEQAITVGETEIPFKMGLITKEDIIGELGEIILDKKTGRLADSDITIYDTTGIALQDLAVSKLALDKELALGIGQIVQL